MAEEKNGTAKHQGIAEVIQALVEAGAFHDGDRHIHSTKSTAKPTQVAAERFAGKQRDTRDGINRFPRDSARGTLVVFCRWRRFCHRHNHDHCSRGMPKARAFEKLILFVRLFAPRLSRHSAPNISR